MGDKPIYDPEQQNEKVTQKGKQVLAPPEQPLVAPTPAIQRQRRAFDVATAPFADRARTSVMLENLSDLLAERRASVRFNTLTGLVRSLRGELYPEQPAASADDMARISKEFLRKSEHQKALLGADGYQWRADSQAIIGSCARFRQTDQNGIPVYGATMVFGFNNDGQLTMINNSWYPIPAEASYEPSHRLSWECVKEIAEGYVHTYFLLENQGRLESPVETPSLAKTPPPPEEDLDLEVIRGDDSQEGLVIFPWLDENKEAAKYRLAWVTLVIDRARARTWEVIVDAENGQVLAAAEATVEDTLRTCVHLNNDQACNDKAEGKKLNDDIPDGELAKAHHFKMQGDAFKEPAKLSPNPQPGECQGTVLSDDGFRSANVYYHLYRALTEFIQIAKNVWSAASAEPPKMPGEGKEEGDKMLVKMLDEPESGKYHHKDDPPYISFGRKTACQQKDPARDCEVIYHEYTHAVLHVVQPDLFDLSLPYPYLHFNEAINEGLAFYFGCTLSERTPQEQPATADVHPYRWGDFAYKCWKPSRDLKREHENPNPQEPEYDYLQVYGVFPRYKGGCNDPSPQKKKRYACGMLWARALWDVRRALGYDIADAIILRGLSLAGGVQSELETPAEAIIHTDGEYTNGGPPHESALRLIFCSRGIMADAPTHDLIEIELGGETYVFAATENTARNNPQPGCMFSDNKGDNWVPLGTDGPAEVVALAAVKVSKTKAIIWAAGEHRAEDGGNVTPTAKVYRYDLEVISGGINTGKLWEELGDDLPKKVNVLSLAAMKNPNGADDECWLFAGTESGLYKYDQRWSGPFPRKLPIYSLTIMEKPSIRLLVGTWDRLPKQGVFAFDPINMKQDHTYDHLPSDLTLTVVADPAGQGHLWAGTASKGVYHFDPSNDQWEPYGTIDSRPVYCLLVEKKQDTGSDTWVLYAGTNNGVYCRIGGGDWEPFNETSDSNAEAIEGTSVVALGRVDGAEGRLLAGTAQRGLWGRTTNTKWTRLTNGLSHIGRLTDAKADSCNWSHTFPKGVGMGTYVLYIPYDNCDELSLDVNPPSVKPELYYVAPYIDLGEDYGAGLKAQTLDNGKVKDVKQGFYLLTAKSDTEYEITVTLIKRGG